MIITTEAAINNAHTFIQDAKRKIEARQAILPDDPVIKKSKKNVENMEASMDVILKQITVLEDPVIKSIINTVKQAMDLGKTKTTIHTVIDLEKMTIDNFII